MFNSDSWQSHLEYQTIVASDWYRISCNPYDCDTHFYEKEKEVLYNLNLDQVGCYVEPFYSEGGRPAKNQAQILRSMILFVMLFNQTKAGLSLTRWVNEVLPKSTALRILVGCSSTEQLPPLGSYYDFMNRFWKGNKAIYSRNKVYPPTKNKNRPKLDIGSDGKLKDPSTMRTWMLVDSILDGKRISDNPERALQDIFFLLAVQPSIDSGLIDAEHLTLSGDGTAVPAHASSYGHIPKALKPCDNPSECPRHYSDPDADWGYDSSKKSYYFGRTLYMLCCRNNEHKVELPVLLYFTKAKRHDSINFLHAFDDFTHHNNGTMPLNMCLDSAHDNYATYHLLDALNINAFIDINGRSRKSEFYPDDILFDKEGHPHCRLGESMIPWGNDSRKRAHKYRCPLKCGKIQSCPHEQECSPGNCGRTVYISDHKDLRFHPNVPRDSEKYKSIYSERTASERVNNRVLNDYQLQSLRIRGTAHYSFWTMLIGICIHLDARYKVSLKSRAAK